MLSKRKLNLKSYWREILMALMAVFIIWLSVADKDLPTVHTGSSYTDCIVHRDTVHVTVEGVRVDTRYVSVPKYITDTIVESDTVTRVYVDTLYDVIELPVTEYVDTSQYYIRTLGWLDSIVIYPNVITHYKTIKERQKFSIYGNTSFQQNQISPGLAATVNRFYVGFNYGLLQKQSQVTVGYRLY